MICLEILQLFSHKKSLIRQLWQELLDFSLLFCFVIGQIDTGTFCENTNNVLTNPKYLRL